MTTRILRPPRIALALRIVVGATLLLAGLAKLVSPYATAHVIESRAIPDGLVLGILAATCELCAGALILLGWFVETTAFVAVLLYIPIAFAFHFPFDRALDVAFDVAMIGGLWFLATRRRQSG